MAVGWCRAEGETSVLFASKCWVSAGPVAPDRNRPRPYGHADTWVRFTSAKRRRLGRAAGGPRPLRTEVSRSRAKRSTRPTASPLYLMPATHRIASRRTPCTSSIRTSTGGRARSSRRFCKRKTFPCAHRTTAAATLSAPGRRRLHPQQLDRVVRSRQAARAHGRARPPGRRGVLDRPFSVFFSDLPPEEGRDAAIQWNEEMAGAQKKYPGPAVGERGGAAHRHPDRHRGAGRRGQPARPDGRQPAGQHRRRPAHRCRAPRAVLCARREARPAAVPASDRRGLRDYARTATTARCT